MLGLLTVPERQRIQNAMQWPTTVQELNLALGGCFIQLPPEFTSYGVAFVHKQTFVVVEAAMEADRQLGSIVLIEGSDVSDYLTDLFNRMPSPSSIVDFISDCQGVPPNILESFKRGQRIVMPKVPVVVEIRGRRQVESVRIIEGAQGLAAIDAALRNASSIESAQTIVGPCVAIDTTTRKTPYLAMGGSLGVVPSNTGGFMVADPELIQSTLLACAQAAEIPTMIERRVEQWFPFYGRSECVGTSGDHEITWRLPNVRVDLRWSRHALTMVSY